MASSNFNLCQLSRRAAFLVVLGMSTAHAGTELVSDLELAIEPPLPETVEPGASGMLQFTITNHGPDDAGFAIDHAAPAVHSSLIPERDDGGLDIYFFPPEPMDDCVMFAVVLDPRPPNTQVLWAYAIHFPPIPANETVTCSLRYLLDPVVTNQQVSVDWTALVFTETDPNPDNDVVDLNFNVGGVVPPQPARPVPGLSIAGIGLLVLGVLCIVGGASRPRHNGANRSRGA